MKNYGKKCRQLTLYFLVLFSCVVVGYALVTQILTITGTSNVTGTWDVKITSIGAGTLTNAENASTPSVSEDGTTATFSVNLQAPGATATYPITITNNGSIPAKLTSVTGITFANSAAPAEVSYSVSGINGETILNDKTTGITDKLVANTGTVTYNVNVIWSSESTTIPNPPLTKTAAIEFNYAQDT